MIIDIAAVTEVHRLSLHGKEVGFFKSKEEAYRVALQMLSNYYISDFYKTGRIAPANKLFKFVYKQVIPTEIADKYETIPTSSEGMLKAIESLVCKIYNNANAIVKVQVENKEIF